VSFLNCYSKCDPLLSQVFVTRQKEGGGEKKISSVLAPGRPKELEGIKDDELGISSWDWNLDGQHTTYHALFPRAWTIYEGPVFKHNSSPCYVTQYEVQSCELDTKDLMSSEPF
jgi:hypothetical protein